MADQFSDETWPDEEFLSYVDTHSQTPRALFSVRHINRFLKLAGQEKLVEGDGFYAMHSWEIQDHLKRAQANLKKVQ